MKQKIFSATLLLCAFGLISAYAEDVFKNDPVVVTATRYEKSVSKEGKSITVVTEDEIKKSGKKTVADVLETVAGVTITRYGTEGSLTNVYIRGSKSGNVLILIDGVKVSDPTLPGNLYDIAGLMTSNIERIEVIKGAMSSMYGAEASGGVINIITKKGAGRKVTITGEAGSNKTFAESVAVSDSTEQSTFFFAGSHYKTDGISSAEKQGPSKYDDDSYENYSASGKMTSKITDTASVNLAMSYTDYKTDLDDGSFEDDPNYEYTSKLFTSRGEFSHSPFAWWTYKGGVSYMSFTRGNIDQADPIDTTENEIYTYNGSNSGIDLCNIFNILNINTLTIGAELRNEKGSSTSASSTYGISIFDEKSIFTKSFFIHDAISVAEIINLNAGARIDDHEVFGSHWTWDASASVIIPVTGTKLKTSAGTGFRAPSMSELYGMWGGNTELKPEKTFVYDAGIYQEIINGLLSVDCTYFVQEYKDKIIYNSSYNYANLDGTIKNKGVETSAVFKPADFLKIIYSYTYVKYEKNNDTSSTLKRPSHKHAVSATLIPLSGLDITGSYLFVDQRYDYLTSTTNIELHSYHKFDMNIRYAFNETITLTARGENLTDEDYEETYGYNTKGRSFYGGAEITL